MSGTASAIGQPLIISIAGYRARVSRLISSTARSLSAASAWPLTLSSFGLGMACGPAAKAAAHSRWSLMATLCGFIAYGFGMGHWTRLLTMEIAVLRSGQEKHSETLTSILAIEDLRMQREQRAQLHEHTMLALERPVGTAH